MRLRKSLEFQEVKEKGHRFRGSALWMQGYVSDDLSRLKFGIIATKKLGCSVLRNSAKRRLREVFRECQDQVKEGSRIVVLPRSQFFKLTHNQLKRHFLMALD